MNLNSLMGDQSVQVVGSDTPQSPNPLIVVSVEYYSGGTISVHCNAEGPGIEKAMKQILEGAIEAVERGEKRSAS